MARPCATQPAPRDAARFRPQHVIHPRLPGSIGGVLHIATGGDALQHNWPAGKTGRGACPTRFLPTGPISAATVLAGRPEPLCWSNAQVAETGFPCPDFSSIARDVGTGRPVSGPISLLTGQSAGCESPNPPRLICRQALSQCRQPMMPCWPVRNECAYGARDLQTTDRPGRRPSRRPLAMDCDGRQRPFPRPTVRSSIPLSSASTKTPPAFPPFRLNGGRRPRGCGDAVGALEAPDLLAPTSKFPSPSRGGVGGRFFVAAGDPPPLGDARNGIAITSLLIRRRRQILPTNRFGYFSTPGGRILPVARRGRNGRGGPPRRPGGARLISRSLPGGPMSLPREPDGVKHAADR